ncbi:MAG TPA: HEAT repeat domain-containing protein [Gemmata sp.]
MRRLFAAIGTCGLAIGVVTAGDVPQPPSSPPAVSELIVRLGSGSFHEREAATAALYKAGPGAIPALREAARSKDPEVRHRAAGALFRLQRTADSAALLAPKKVALAYRNAPLGTALNDLSTRTGVKIALDPERVANPLRTVTCETGELPVWEAIERFCAAAGLEEVNRLELDVPKQPLSRHGYVSFPQPPAPGAVPVTLIDGRGRLPGARATAVRVVAVPRSFPGHRVTLGTGETTLCFDIAPAPGLNWQDVVAVKVHKLIDDAGRTGGAGSEGAEPARNGSEVVVQWGGGPGGGFVMGGGRFDPQTGRPILPESVPNPRIVPVPLKLGTPTAKSIKRLEGCVLGEVLVANQYLITVPDPVKQSQGSFNGPGQTRLTIDAVSDAPNGDTRVLVKLQHPAPWAVSARRGRNPGGVWPEAPRGADHTPTLKGLDAQGREVALRTRTNLIDNSDDGLALIHHIQLEFRKGAAPAKLVLVGSRPAIVEVPFVLENVPLP